MRTLVSVISILFLGFLLSSCQGQAQSLNGFDLSNLSIDAREVMQGGPPRDGIPSIDQPQFVPANQVDYLQPDDLVIGLSLNGEHRAYPTRILVWHEIVNDVIGGLPVAVTYCPLCGTAMVFERRFDDQVLEFGVSGLLYRSDVLMYDRQSESLWSQLKMAAVSGPWRDTQMTWLPSDHITWQAWKQAHPTGQVLSVDTGFRRNYGRSAYASYFASDSPMFPVPRERTELPDKAWVIGVLVGDQARAYPVNDLPTMPIEENLPQGKLRLVYDAEARFPEVFLDGELQPSVMVFWFAWQAFYPDTELWMP